MTSVGSTSSSCRTSLPRATESTFAIQWIATDYPARQKGAEDLYDLQTDPRERTNLAAKPEHAQRLAEMRASVLTWWKQTGGKPIDALAE